MATAHVRDTPKAALAMRAATSAIRLAEPNSAGMHAASESRRKQTDSISRR